MAAVFDFVQFGEEQFVSGGFGVAGLAGCGFFVEDLEWISREHLIQWFISLELLVRGPTLQGFDQLILAGESLGVRDQSAFVFFLVAVGGKPGVAKTHLVLTIFVLHVKGVDDVIKQVLMVVHFARLQLLIKRNIVHRVVNAPQTHGALIVSPQRGLSLDGLGWRHAPRD